MPMLPDDKQVQVHLSRNDRPQPFYLVCGKDSLLSLMSGAAKVEFKGTAIDHFALTPGSFVYVPAGAPHRIVPTETSVTLRYKQMHAGLEGIAWYCDSCDEEIYREVWDTASSVSQLKYDEVSPVLLPTHRCVRAAIAERPIRRRIWKAFVGPKWGAESRRNRPLPERPRPVRVTILAPAVAPGLSPAPFRTFGVA